MQTPTRPQLRALVECKSARFVSESDYKSSSKRSSTLGSMRISLGSLKSVEETGSENICEECHFDSTDMQKRGKQNEWVRKLFGKINLN